MGSTTQIQKRFVDSFSLDVVNKETDLIILFDGSGSMIPSGFDIAKQFVKSLLSEVRIAFNATRVAVGTFSTRSQINLNYILNPSYRNHKCKFNEDFHGIQLDGQLTNLRASLKDADNDNDNVFRQLDFNPVTNNRRKGSNKVVLLLSDGYENIYNGQLSSLGSDASQEALRLKQNGAVKIYTISV